LKDAGARQGTTAAINASGSFPGFVLASLSACHALGVKAVVIASVGASSYGANMYGNTIADILLKDKVRGLNHKLLAVTPGGSGDRGLELDAGELKRISLELENQGIPFIRPANLEEAVSLRESLFKDAGCTLLINIGGSHAASGNDSGLGLLAGVIRPDKKKKYGEEGLIQFFLNEAKHVIQVLNIKKLYAAYGLYFDENGELLRGGERLYRYRKLSPFAVILPPVISLILFGVLRNSRKNKRLG